MPMMQPPSGPGSAPGPMQSSAPPMPGGMAPPGGLGSAPPGMGGPPDMTGMQPPDGAPEGGVPETPDFEDAMAALVQHALPTLNPQDIKVLTKSLTPDSAWVLSKIFGPKAITMLEMAANPKLATAPMGPTGQIGLGAQGGPPAPAPQGQPTGGMPPVA